MPRTARWMVHSMLVIESAMVAVASADGPGAYLPHERPAESSIALPDAGAIDAYNTGYALIQRAEHAEALAAAATADADRLAAQRKARDSYEASLEALAAAVRLDPSMHEALTYIGYASRKLGRHDAALDAYARALRIHPDYPHAIEYQGQAFLALNRLEEARFNYLRLYGLNAGQAGKLLRAMQAWVETHQGDPPEGLDIEAFAAWVTERAKAHEGESAAGRSASW